MQVPRRVETKPSDEKLVRQMGRTTLTMKKEASKAIVISVAVIAVLAVVALFVFGTRTPELPGEKKAAGYIDGIPSYVKNAQEGRPNVGDTSHLTPEQKAQIQQSMQGAGR